MAKSSLRFIGFTVRQATGFPAFAIVYAEASNGECYAIYPSGDKVKVVNGKDGTPRTSGYIRNHGSIVAFRSGEQFIYRKRNVNFAFSEDDFFIGSRQLLAKRLARRIMSLEALPYRSSEQKECLGRFQTALASVS